MRGFFDDTKDYDKQWFINEAKKLYGNRFSFENTDYISIRRDIIITCNLHGDFKKRPYAFLRQNRHCKECHRIEKAEEFIKKLQSFTDKYTLDIDSFVSISKKCKFINNEKQIIKIISPNGLFERIKESKIRLANKKPKKIKPPPPPKIPFVPSVVAKQNHHIVENAIYVKSGTTWFVNNVYCQFYNISYNSSVTNFRLSKVDNCKNCSNDARKITNQLRQQKNKEKLFNQLKNVCLVSNTSLDFSNYSLINNKIHISCKLHGPIRLNRKLAFKAIRTKNADRICPSCYKVKNSIFLKFPDLLKDWDYNKNKISPNLITKGCGKKIFWKCHRCQLDFQCLVGHKIKLHNGCPGCTIKTSSRIERIIYYFIKQIFGHKSVKHNGRLKNKNNKVCYDMLITNIQPNIIIEYDGSQYHKNKIQYDLNKITRIHNMNLHCIRIREYPLTQLQPIDIEYKFVDYNNIKFDAHITELIHNILIMIQNNFTLTPTVQKKVTFGLSQKFSFSAIPKNFFLYPLLGTSMMDFHPELVKHWDLTNNILTLKQVSKSDGVRRWWICESCGTSFKSCCKPIIKKLKVKQSLQCRTCLQLSKPIKLKKVKLPFINKNIHYHNGKYTFKYRPQTFLTDLRRNIRSLTRSYVVTNMKVKKGIINCVLVKRKMQKGVYQFVSEKIKFNFEITKKLKQICVWN